MSLRARYVCTGILDKGAEGLLLRFFLKFVMSLLLISLPQTGLIASPENEYRAPFLNTKHNAHFLTEETATVFFRICFLFLFLLTRVKQQPIALLFLKGMRAHAFYRLRSWVGYF